MIPLLDASPAKITEIAAELGAGQFGQLITPLTGYRVHDGSCAKSRELKIEIEGASGG